ncbi:MAG: hypothetical protein JSU89_16970 [Myxococcales bacterium]|nr:MAG: hypothetical protein JSU89_16970 [Myxococcales bacterium]
MNPREELAREALRLHERYHRELIERFSVCPWAKPARADGRTRAHVVTDATSSPRELMPVLGEWAANEAVDVAFVIMPRFAGGADAFTDWAMSIGAQLADVFLSAPFYPSAPDSAGSIHFLRQTPDPTVQLVRRSRLEEIRAQDPPHYTDIFDLNLRDLEAEKTPRTVAASVLAHNERMIEREGRAELQDILDDIRNDRERTYAKLFPLL